MNQTDEFLDTHAHKGSGDSLPVHCSYLPMCNALWIIIQSLLVHHFAAVSTTIALIHCSKSVKLCFVVRPCRILKSSSGQFIKIKD